MNGRFHGYGILYDFNHENISNGIFKHGELQKNMLMCKEKVRHIFKENYPLIFMRFYKRLRRVKVSILILYVILFTITV